MAEKRGGARLDLLMSRTDSEIPTAPTNRPAKGRKETDRKEKGGKINPAAPRPEASPIHKRDDATMGRTLGRPRTIEEKMDRVTLDLPLRQVNYLTSISMAIKARTGNRIKLVHIVRIILDAMEASSIDLSTADSSEQMRAIMDARLSAKR